MLGSSNENPKEVESKKQPENLADKFLLDKLPLDLLKIKINTKGEVVATSNISRYLSLTDMQRLACTNKSFFSIFNNERIAVNLAIKKFLDHVVRGEKIEVEEMLKKNPDLLLHKAKVVDEAGRTIYGTAYQIALGAKDVSPFPGKVEEMAEMLEHYLLQLPNGEKEREKQYNEQFPEGFEKEEEARRMSDSLELNKVFTAIKNAKTIEVAEEAVKEFQAYLKNQTKGGITIGYHFNEALFEEALTLYNKHYDNFGEYNSPKNRLAAIKLVGFFESLFPTNLAQAACDGFGKVLEQRRPLSRGKLLDDEKKTPFFDVNLGVTHFVYSFSSCAMGRECGRTWKAHCFKTYVEQKTTTLSNCKISLLSEVKREVYQDEISLNDLPQNVVQLIGNYISDDADKAKFVRLNKQVNNFFQPNLHKLAVEKFLHHVAYGEKDEAEKMLKSNPKLLLERGIVTDEAGRTIYGTAYQIALGAKDVSPYSDQFEEMAEMLERYLLQLPNGEEERQKQYAEQFPEGFEKQEEARRMSDSFELNKVFAAIKKDKTTGLAEANKAVAEFQNYLENQIKGVITTGYHFNEALFQEAPKLYDEHYDDFGGFDSDKNRLAAIKLIGFIQRFFPANLAQAVCDGIERVVDEKKMLTRGKVLDDKKTPFFNPSLGVSHFVYSYWGVVAGLCDTVCDFCGVAFKTYVEQKQQPYQTANYRY